MAVLRRNCAHMVQGPGVCFSLLHPGLCLAFGCLNVPLVVCMCGHGHIQYFLCVRLIVSSCRVQAVHLRGRGVAAGTGGSVSGAAGALAHRPPPAAHPPGNPHPPPPSPAPCSPTTTARTRTGTGTNSNAHAPTVAAASDTYAQAKNCAMLCSLFCIKPQQPACIGLVISFCFLGPFWVFYGFLSCHLWRRSRGICLPGRSSSRGSRGSRRAAPGALPFCFSRRWMPFPGSARASPCSSALRATPD